MMPARRTEIDPWPSPSPLQEANGTEAPAPSTYPPP